MMPLENKNKDQNLQVSVMDIILIFTMIFFASLVTAFTISLYERLGIYDTLFIELVEKIKALEIDIESLKKNQQNSNHPLDYIKNAKKIK
jgi:hypothetical protein